MTSKIKINRAPVLTLWAAVVAQRLGHDRGAALTLGKAVAGLNAQTKGRRLGIYKSAEGGGAAAKAHERAAPAKRTQANVVELLHRHVPVTRTAKGLRAVERGHPADPAAVTRYLEARFGDALAEARAAMAALARAFPAPELKERAFSLYEAFRPGIPKGTRGWGAAGVLDLDRVRALAPGGGAGAKRARAVRSRTSRPAPRARRPS